MAFPTATFPLEEALDQIVGTAIDLKRRITTIRDLSAAGDTARFTYIRLLQTIKESVDIWDKAASTPGIDQYAKDQFSDPGLDIVAEYTAMKNAAVSLQNWIFTALPTDAGSGAVLLNTVNVNGELGELTFTSAQTQGFRTEADAFIATIN
jgi:hypothetical protein